jgi:hypothetical protein
MDLPAALSDAQVLAMVGGANHAQQIDRDLFKYGFFDLTNGNHVATVVTYEITGNVNVQRMPGLYVFSPGSPNGAGDVTLDGLYANDDVDGFARLVTSHDTLFSAVADLDGDGLMTVSDWARFGQELRALHDGGVTRAGGSGELLVSQVTLDHYESLSGVVPEPASAALIVFVPGLGARRSLSWRRRRNQN